MMPIGPIGILKYGIGYQLVLVTTRDRPKVEVLGIRCNRCKQISFNVNDIRERYCGACHVFFEDGPGQIA